jgi:regulator of sigma E protease
MENFIQIGVGLLALGFLVFIHELGHFAVAKWNKVHVETFAVGFGPTLLQKKWGETTYCIKALPFGGFVKMSGEEPGDKARSYSEGDFSKKSIPVRAAIAFAGPAVNIIFAFLLILAIYLTGYPKMGSDSAVIGYVEPQSPGAVAGLLLGDTVIRAGDREIKKWSELQEEIGMHKEVPITLTVRRVDGEKSMEVIPREMEARGHALGVGDAGIDAMSVVTASADPVAPYPAHAAGVQKGDTLVALNGQPVYGPSRLFAFMKENREQTFVLTVGRSTGRVDLSVTPRFDTAAKRYLMGLPLGMPVRYEQHGVRSALTNTLNDCWSYVMAPLRFIQRLVTGGIDLKAMSGPVGIVQVVGKTFAYDFVQLLLLVALISMSLGVMNLLPLAITDGGLLLFLALEAIRGKPLSDEVQGRIQQVAVFFFLSLFLYVTLQDILRFSLFWD